MDKQTSTSKSKAATLVCYWKQKWCFGFTPKRWIWLFCIAIIAATNFAYFAAIRLWIFGHEKVTALIITNMEEAIWPTLNIGTFPLWAYPR